MEPESIQLFDFMVDKPEIESEFLAFFHKNNLDALFTDEQRTNHVKVRLPDMESVVNGGKYANDLKNLSDIMATAMDNKAYQRSMFKIILNAGSFQKFMNNVREVVRYFETGVFPEHKYNYWNIVYYNKSLFK